MNTLIYTFKVLPIIPRDSDTEKMVFSVLRKFDKFLFTGKNLAVFTQIKYRSATIPGGKSELMRGRDFRWMVLSFSVIPFSQFHLKLMPRRSQYFNKLIWIQCFNISIFICR